MSRISDQIRAYVNDPDVADHYGAWGILRKDQRRLIRKLCDTCDMFERTADDAMHQVMQRWISVEERLPEEEGDYLIYSKHGFIEIERFKLWEDDDMEGGFWWELEGLVTHWMPLPEAPKGGAE